MRTLSDTISRLAALQAQHGAGNHAVDNDLLSDLQDFGSNPGALRARICIPDQLPEGAPLVVVLHGCTQTAAGYDHGSGWSRLADQEGFALLFPEQQRGNNANLCFNWFVPADTRRGDGEALSIRQMIETLVVLHNLDRRRIFVTGLSAGGAMASVMLAAYPEVFAGGAIIAGLPYGAAKTVPEAFDRMRGHGVPSEQQLQELVRDASPHEGPWPRISVWHGSADGTVAASNAQAIVGQWREVHGVDLHPTSSEVVEGYVRHSWSDTEGRELIEEYSIAGMGHGTPLATGGKNGLGAGGPFMLEVGISSTRHIAHFWGIADPAQAAETQAARQKSAANPHDVRNRETEAYTNLQSADPRRQPARPSASSRPQPSAGIQKTIEDALRSAGLMR